ncbi:hypothetical protein D3C80_1282430 [compost metagenome]
MLDLTDSSAPESARWFWAMAQVAALSLAPWTLSPVFTRLWVAASLLFVELRFWSAMSADALVSTLLVMASSPSSNSDLQNETDS